MRLLLTAALALAALPSAAQPARSYGSTPPRIGVGFDLVATPPGQSLLPSGVALGIRGRAALPVNADVSVAGDLGLAAQLFRGRDEATYVFNPQVGAIATIGRGQTARYVMGGFGGFLPLDGSGGGPTVHVGYGWAVPMSETSFYLEVNPSLLVGQRETTVVLPVRAGLIF